MRRRTALLIAVLAAVLGALVATPVAVFAAHQFTDVPNTNPFHDDIDWLADAQVTLGCGPNVYCPKDNVTREQMAAFMRRLAENQVVDAGELEGYKVGELIRGNQNVASSGLPQGNVDVISTTLDLPTAGVVVAGGKVNMTSASGDTVQCQMRDGTNTGFGVESVKALDPNLVGTCQTTGAKVLPAGQHTINLHLFNVGGDVTHHRADVWAVFIPFDGTGDTP